MMKRDKIRVLIAEDDYLVAEMIKGILEELEYAVIGHAGNGEEVLAMAPELNPDIILMDIEMPVMDGLEATRQLMETNPLPVVVLSAYESRELVDKASAAGVGAYLVKPSNAQELERAITVAIARFNDIVMLRRKNRELQEALKSVKILSGFLPICAACKKIRDGDGEWRQIEHYIRDHSEAEFSHGMCPECIIDYYPGTKNSQEE